MSSHLIRGKLMVPRTLHSVLALAAATALTVATVAPAAAAEAPVAGAGTSSGAASVLNLVLGDDSLVVRLLGEDSLTSNDPSAGGPSALERVTPLSITSTLLPALDAVSQPTLETNATSGEDARSTPAVDLASILAGLPVPGLLSGTIDPVALRSAVDASGAVSTVTGALRDVSVLGGLLGVGTASADLGSGALSTDANAIRGLHLDRVEVLDLTQLLELVGISLTDLPIDAAVGLLAGLGLPLPGDLSPQALLDTIGGLLSDTSAVRGQVSALTDQVAPLTAQLATATDLVDSLTAELLEQQALLDACGLPVLCPLVTSLVTSLTAELATATSTVTDLESTIDGLLDQVDALLAPIQGLVDQLLGLVDGVLDGLDGAPLLVVEDLLVGVTARAEETLAASVATVVGSVGDVTVGSLPSLGGVDGAAALSQVRALADELTATLGGLLATVDPALAELLDIDLLDQASAVTESDGVTSALAGITGLRATITPPDVCGLLDRLGAQETVGSLLSSVDSALPTLPGPVGEVLGGLGSTVTCTTAAGTVSAAGLVDGVATALTQPLTVEALSVTGAGTFDVAGSPVAPDAPGAPAAPSSGTLPSTGGGGELALVAAGLGAAALITRRFAHRAG